MRKAVTDLIRVQNPIQKSFSKSLVRRSDPLHFDNINANSQNHFLSFSSSIPVSGCTLYHSNHVTMQPCNPCNLVTNLASIPLHQVEHFLHRAFHPHKHCAADDTVADV